MAADQAQALRALREQVKVVEKYLDKCQLYGPADHLRGAVERCVVLADALASPEPPHEVTADPALGFDEASKITGWLRAYGFFVPDAAVRTILISIRNDSAKAATPEPSSESNEKRDVAPSEPEASPEPPADAPPAPEET